jgi:hypothetical protein
MSRGAFILQRDLEQARQNWEKAKLMMLEGAI